MKHLLFEDGINQMRKQSQNRVDELIIGHWKGSSANEIDGLWLLKLTQESLPRRGDVLLWCTTLTVEEEEFIFLLSSKSVIM